MNSHLRGGGSKILEKCEDHYIKSHKKCEDGGGVGNCQKRCEIIFERPLNYQVGKKSDPRSMTS